MGSVMMRVVSAARGGGAGAGCAGRQAAGKDGKRPTGSMAGAAEGGGGGGSAGPEERRWWPLLLRHRREPRTWPRRRCRPGNPAGFINGRDYVTGGAPPRGGPALRRAAPRRTALKGAAARRGGGGVLRQPPAALCWPRSAGKGTEPQSCCLRRTELHTQHPLPPSRHRDPLRQAAPPWHRDPLQTR